ncbi:hypothetical protein LCGC14_0598630, partial [marine sediment metagenome]
MPALTSVTKEKGILTFTYDDGTILKRTIIYADTIVSTPPDGYDEIGNCYIDSSGRLVINYNGNSIVLDPVGGAGDMLKSIYDADNNGIVDNAEKLEGSTKSEVQDHTPKAHTLGSHSTKAHNELSGVGVNDHHAKYLNSEAVAAAKTVKLDDFTTPDDNVDLDASAALHGLMSKVDKGKLDGIEALADVTGSTAPQAHGPSHEDTGGDEISVAGLDGKTAELSTHETITNAATGFPNRGDSVLSFDTVTFTITPAVSTFDYYIAGAKYTKSSAENIVIADTSGVHFIYYDGSTLSASINPSNAAIEDIILNKAWVATIYWQTTGAGAGVAPLLADERHGVQMSGKTHHWLHDINGAAWHDGLTLSGYTEATDSDAALTFELTNGVYFDEDLEHTIIDGAPATQYAQQLNGGDAEIPIVYRNAAGIWVQDAASTLPYKLISAGNRLAFNRDDGGGNWSQVEVADGKWVSMTLIATNDWQYPIKAIQGQNEYTDKKTAVEEATAEIISFGGGTLSPEVITLYRFVMQTKDTFSGTKKAKIETDGVTDFRGAQILGEAAAAGDHGTLSGLADDDHAQYIRADGTRALSGAWDMGSQLITNLKLGGTMDANSQALINVLDLDLGTESAMGTFSATLTAANAGTAWLIKSKDTSDILRPRLGLSGGVDTAVWAWVNSTHTGIVTSDIDINGGTLDGVTITAPVLDGTVTNTGATLVMPTFGMGAAAITGHAQAITDNAVVTVDGPAAGAPASGEYAKWTAIGLEGKSKAEQLSDLN